MATQSARRPDSLQATCETESEASDVFTDSSEDETSDEQQSPARAKASANVGTKRSDPSIVTKKNKYATSDSGYSSLTATTASSSKSKKIIDQPTSKTERFMTNIKKPFTKATPAEQRPEPPRRMSQRHERLGRDERLGRELRSVESREEAARISTASIRATTGRRPSMPGGYPPSPTESPALPQGSSAPRAVPRPRASTTAQGSGTRPVGYHAGSAPQVYQIPVAPQQGHAQHFVLTPQQQQHYQQQQQYQQQLYYQSQAQMAAQPLHINTSAYQGGSPYGYVSTPTSSSPFTPNHAYPTNYHYQQQQQTQPHQAHPQYWPATSGGYPGTLGEHYEAHARRMSMSNNVMQGHYNMSSQYQEPQAAPPPHHAHVLRRMSQSVQPTHQPFQPPRQTHTPFQESPFEDTYEPDEPEDYYGSFRETVDRFAMPPPPVRPASSHRPRLAHARTASGALPPSVHRLSHGSAEYDMSPRKQSLEGTRPPSRPGMPARNSTTAARYYAEPSSPARTRRSIYGHADLETTMEAAESYQHAKSGGISNNVVIDDLPPMSRRHTRTSDTGSKDSRGSGSRENKSKRSNRHSLDKSRLRETHERDTGVTLAVGGVQLKLKEGKMTIRQSNEAIREDRPDRPVLMPASSSKPTRESSRARPEKPERPEVKRYISGSTSTRSSKEKDGEVEIPRKRRSSSVTPHIGRDHKDRELLDSLRRLKMDDSTRASRRSSRSGRAPVDG